VAASAARCEINLAAGYALGGARLHFLDRWPVAPDDVGASRHAHKIADTLGGLQVDIKSSGILGACLIIAALIVALVPRPQLAASGPQVSRFQMGGVPGHAYVIDTATGQVWEDFAIPTQGSSNSDFKSPKVK
jgi:hypothetical protein